MTPARDVGRSRRVDCNGRGETLETVTGTGEDKLAAMTCLTIAKDDRRRGELLEEIDRLRRDS